MEQLILISLGVALWVIYLLIHKYINAKKLAMYHGNVIEYVKIGPFGIDIWYIDSHGQLIGLVQCGEFIHWLPLNCSTVRYFNIETVYEVCE